MVTELVSRILQAYSRVHPSMYPHMEWRISKETADFIADHVGVGTRDEMVQNKIFGMPIRFTDSDEILLVMKV